MDPSISVTWEEEFKCCICLEVLTDPVSTPCGHNFCLACIEKYWTRTEDHHCPLCKERFNTKPELKVNTTFRAVVQHFQMKKRGSQPAVPWDVCFGQEMKAVKSCLDCRTSFCGTHLENHKTAQSVIKHRLMDPVENLEDYICQKHGRPLELFCRDDQTCVCQFCTESDHKTHSTVPIEEESGQKKTHLRRKQEVVQQMIKHRQKKIKNIRISVQLNKKSHKKSKAHSLEVFSSLVRCIERSQAELLELMEEKQKAAERQAEEFIKELEQEITELKRRDTELEQLSHTEDHLYLLQIYPSLCSPPHTKNWTNITINTHLRVESLSKALSQLHEVFNKELKRFSKIVSKSALHKVQPGNAPLFSTTTSTTVPAYSLVGSTVSFSNHPKGLEELQTKYAVNVTLDPKTAYPKLLLSADRKQVWHSQTWHKAPNNPERFDTSACVLGKEGFSSGRFYYEVQVSGKTAWVLGVARESVNRKGIISLSPENGYWTVCLRKENECLALDSPPVILSLKQPPQKVGVFVDYEGELVSFYDVEVRSHIYSFTGQSFTEKLYPFFFPCNKGESSKPMIISPIMHGTEDTQDLGCVLKPSKLSK